MGVPSVLLPAETEQRWKRAQGDEEGYGKGEHYCGGLEAFISMALLWLVEEHTTTPPEAAGKMLWSPCCA